MHNKSYRKLAVAFSYHHFLVPDTKVRYYNGVLLSCQQFYKNFEKLCRQFILCHPQKNG